MLYLKTVREQQERMGGLYTTFSNRMIKDGLEFSTRFMHNLLTKISCGLPHHHNA
jgi:hypothetical protein